MNCLIILLLLACGGCQNSWGGGCGCARSGNNSGQSDRDRDCGCQRDRERDRDCPCMGEDRGSVRRTNMPEERDHHDHHDHDRRQGGPAAWNNFPSISGGETCGCDAE